MSNDNSSGAVEGIVHGCCCQDHCIHIFTGRKWQWNVGLICVDLMNALTESDIYREQLTT